ncbi:hypothetical protein MMC13_002102 [Lambiella insularis]|nr:hypothetical protein [Lambiella insularis]
MASLQKEDGYETLSDITRPTDIGNKSGVTEVKNIAVDNTSTKPAAVCIDVRGAFIVNDGIVAPQSVDDVGAVHGARDIRLPHHNAVVSHVAVDIGGSLAKLVYFSREPKSREHGGRLSFINFETHSIGQCLDFIKRLKSKQQELNGSIPGELCVMATGGGAYKYYDGMKEALGVEVVREDEMECLIIGLDFFITEIPNEVFTYNEIDFLMRFADVRATIYPYLLVNIGSGVSMIKVSGPKKYQRLGGTSLGGGTLWGLLSLLTGARTFDEMLAMADRGDNAAVDMSVGDIFGTDCGKVGLRSGTIASSFGKVFKMKQQAENDAEDGGGLVNDNRAEVGGTIRCEHNFRPEDISRSLLYAISNNIGSLAYLQSEKHELEHIYFGGSFIREHRQTMSTLSYAINFWSTS